MYTQQQNQQTIDHSNCPLICQFDTKFVHIFEIAEFAQTISV